MVILIERLLIICYPLRACRWATRRHAMCLTLSVLLVSCLLASPVLYIYSLVPSTAYQSSVACLPITDSNTFISELITLLKDYISTDSMTIYPLIFLFILPLTISYKSRLLSNRTALLAAHNEYSIYILNTLRYSKLFLYLSIVQLSLYLPYDIILSLFKYYRILIPYGRFFASLTIFSKLLNIYLYWILIPCFKQDVYHILQCKQIL